jgi:hypothetical protein
MTNVALVEAVVPAANGTSTTPAVAPARVNTFANLSSEVLHGWPNDIGSSQAEMVRDMLRTRVHHLTDATLRPFLASRTTASELIRILKPRQLVSKNVVDTTSLPTDF